ncbi:MAG: folate-binding protein YgfZ [Proteobacteria bacterium]|jgi:folate-binding protein YgfZ|nr:folate-binding protein YgfZ [Pseudomonadota bacterium]MBT7966264.1 folate-binding protein YgfZ [Pseudomonadota bacterium]
METVVIRCTGEDSTTFLQNQLTADIESISQEQWGFAGYCSAKGRLFATFAVFPIPEGFYLVTHASVVEAVVARFELFRMRSKVNFTVEHDCRMICEYSTRPQTLPESFAKYMRANISQPIKLGVVSQALVTSQLTAVEIDDENVLDQNLAVALSENGIAWVEQSMTERFLPQSLNLDLIGAVSFKKGCYPGQEIVARIRYRGKPKQRMIAAQLPASFEGVIGDAIDLGDDSDSRNATIVCRTYDSIQDRILMLATVPISALDLNLTQHAIADRISIKRIDLPYTVPTETVDGAA